MKKFFELVVVIPVGPRTKIDFIEDTINSLIHYVRSDYRIVIMDDSHEGMGEELQKRFPQSDLRYTYRSLGSMAGLYINLAMTYKWVLERYRFRALFKLDTDALITGPAPEEMALALFRDNPRVGIAGQYPGDYHGTPWDIGWPRARILNGATTWKFIRRPRTNWYLRKLYKKALLHGYKAGESVFGGAYFMSEPFLINLNMSGLLPDYRLKKLNLGEDHIFSLIAKSRGFGLAGLSSADMPFACAWKGLPCSPEELWRQNKKIIHSTRSFNGMEEENIRAFFREKRAEDLQFSSFRTNSFHGQ